MRSARIFGWSTTAVFAGAIGAAIWHAKRRAKASGAAIDPVTRDRLIAASLLSMPLLMPYYMDYDLLLLAVPAVLLAASRLQARSAVSRARVHARADRWVAVGLAGVFFWPIVETALLKGTRWHLSVPFLAVAAACAIRQCFEQAPVIAALAAAPEASSEHDIALAA